MSFNPHLSNKFIIKLPNGSKIYPVYILARVVRELINFCESTHPNEALGFLMGHRIELKGNPDIMFTRITDWVTGSVESTHFSASFTTEGLQQANIYLDDKYGKSREQNAELPRIIGIVHSHPFGFEPNFSSRDIDTFLNFPYDAFGNVFILIDPIPENPYFKVYTILKRNSHKILQMVPWIEYSSIQSDLSTFKDQKNNIQISKMISNDPDHSKIIDKSEFNSSSKTSYNDISGPLDDPLDDPLFNPPKIENLKKSKKKKKQLRDIFD